MSGRGFLDPGKPFEALTLVTKGLESKHSMENVVI